MAQRLNESKASGTTEVDPASIAGVLLRESESPQHAHAYAVRKARFLAATGCGDAGAYVAAAKAIAVRFGLDRGPT